MAHLPSRDYPKARSRYVRHPTLRVKKEPRRAGAQDLLTRGRCAKMTSKPSTVGSLPDSRNTEKMKAAGPLDLGECNAGQASLQAVMSGQVAFKAVQHSDKVCQDFRPAGGGVWVVRRAPT